MRLVILIFLLLLPMGSFAQRGNSTSRQGAEDLGPQNVWHLPNNGRLWEEITDECGQRFQEESAYVDCVASRMRRAGASRQAIAFVRQMKGQVYMGYFREMGRVDVATLVGPVLNDPNVTDFILVNGEPHIVTLWENVENIDISRASLYPALKRRFPEVTMLPIHTFDGMRRLPQGGAAIHHELCSAKWLPCLRSCRFGKSRF